MDGEKTDIQAGASSGETVQGAAFELWKQDKPGYAGTEADWLAWLDCLTRPQEKNMRYFLIEKGMSAVTLSKRISKYLLDFPQLQKDYKEKFGRASTALDCEYRSIRLAASEINMAYRTAENERWKQMDFVVGYEIKLSGNHTLNGEPFSDICDRLAGKYPKDFVWTGWHPLCRCYKIPILKTEEEFWAWNGRSDVSTKSVNEVKDVPDNFKQWVGTNAYRIEKAKDRGTLPYFIKDNLSYIIIKI